MSYYRLSAHLISHCIYFLQVSLQWCEIINMRVWICAYLSQPIIGRVESPLVDHQQLDQRPIFVISTTALCSRLQWSIQETCATSCKHCSCSEINQRSWYKDIFQIDQKCWNCASCHLPKLLPAEISIKSSHYHMLLIIIGSCAAELIKVAEKLTLINGNHLQEISIIKVFQGTQWPTGADVRGW